MNLHKAVFIEGNTVYLRIFLPLLKKQIVSSRKQQKNGRLRPNLRTFWIETHFKTQ